MSLPGIATLIDSARAPNPRRVKVFMAEKGVEFPVEDVSIMEGEHSGTICTGLVHLLCRPLCWRTARC